MVPLHGGDMTYDDALEELAALDPQWSGFGSDGLQNHTTMVAHALHALGHDARIAPQLETTRSRYRPLRESAGTPELGDGRVRDWLVHWDAAIAREGWRAVLRRASRELAPGILAGAFHGWIRVAHVARALLARETPARLHELALGLAVWSSWYQEIAAPIAGEPAASVQDLLESIPESRMQGEGLIHARVAAAARRDDVRRWAGRIHVEGDTQEVITQVTKTAARCLAGAPAEGVSGHLHGLTASSALRPLLPLIDWPALAPAFIHAFGALVASHSRGDARHVDADADSLRSKAGEVDDDHVIKVIEAALREHRATGDPIYLSAAAYVTHLRGG